MRFEFPDVASLPDNIEPVFPEKVSFEPLAGDWRKDIAKWFRLATNVMRLPLEESRILQKQLNSVARAAALKETLRPARKDSAIWSTGMMVDKLDTDPLIDTFYKDIKTLIDQEPYEPAIEQIDHAITRADTAARNAVRHHLRHFLSEVNAYRDRVYDIDSVTVHVSKPTDRHHYQQFRDCETTTKLQNLHVDPKPGVMKALIYLDEVGESNGPFQTMPGSNHWEIDPVDQIFAWGNSIGNYCHTPAHRRAANALPRKFRGNAIIGRLLPDGSEMSNMFLDGMTTWTSNMANTFVFDPCFMFHRGGLCQKAMRVNLQVRLR